MDSARKKRWDALREEIASIDPEEVYYAKLATNVAVAIFLQAINVAAGVNKEGLIISAETVRALAKDAKACGAAFAHIMLNEPEEGEKEE